MAWKPRLNAWQECRHEVGSANSVATKTLQLMDGDAMTVSQVNREFVEEKVEQFEEQSGADCSRAGRAVVGNSKLVDAGSAQGLVVGYGVGANRKKHTATPSAAAGGTSSTSTVR